jgi:hypothetical protein
MACFFVLNKPAAGCSVYDYPLAKKWMRISRITIKLAVVLLLAKSFYEALQYARESKTITARKDFKPGIYDVTRYVVNRDTLPALITDTMRWKDFVIENNSMGSINTDDTLFRRRYGRGYFIFTVDTLSPVIHFKKSMQDAKEILSLQYQLPDSNTILLWGKRQNDSVFIELKRSARHFQLAEKQFHWLSEANR